MSPDPRFYLLSARHLDALRLCCQKAEIDGRGAIDTLLELQATQPELVTVRIPPDADLYERVEATATALGRSLVHAYLVGQCEAYYDTRQHAERKTCACLKNLEHRWETARDEG